MTNNKNTSWDKAWKTVVIILGVLASMTAILLFIYKSVDIITNNDKFLNKLASKINPYIIFDSNERYLKDGGAMEYLKDDIKVIKGFHPDFDDSLKAPVQIIIRTKKLLSFEPQINCLDGENEELIKVRRGKNTIWIFDLSGWLSNNPGGIDTFRVELIP
jgi:hypothetical protein